jgi:hypothetical protein
MLRASFIVDRAGRATASASLALLTGGIAMANKDQSKGKAKTNAPKLTAKQKKEKKAKKAASKGQQ